MLEESFVLFALYWLEITTSNEDDEEEKEHCYIYTNEGRCRGARTSGHEAIIFTVFRTATRKTLLGSV